MPFCLSALRGLVHGGLVHGGLIGLHLLLRGQGQQSADQVHRRPGKGAPGPQTTPAPRFATPRTPKPQDPGPPGALGPMIPSTPAP